MKPTRRNSLGIFRTSKDAARNIMRLTPKRRFYFSNRLTAAFVDIFIEMDTSDPNKARAWYDLALAEREVGTIFLKIYADDPKGEKILSYDRRAPIQFKDADIGEFAEAIAHTAEVGIIKQLMWDLYQECARRLKLDTAAGCQARTSSWYKITNAARDVAAAADLLQE